MKESTEEVRPDEVPAGAIKLNAAGERTAAGSEREMPLDAMRCDAGAESTSEADIQPVELQEAALLRNPSPFAAAEPSSTGTELQPCQSLLENVFIVTPAKGSSERADSPPFQRQQSSLVVVVPFTPGEESSEGAETLPAQEGIDDMVSSMDLLKLSMREDAVLRSAGGKLTGGDDAEPQDRGGA